MRWLITNRKALNDGFGPNFGSLTYWTLDEGAGKDITLRSSWTQMTPSQFQTALVRRAQNFPPVVNTPMEEQKHVTLFIHGFNNGFMDAIQRYNDIAVNLFDGQNGLGEIISFDWPSKDSLLGYLPDQSQARQTGDDLTNVLDQLYTWLLPMQAKAALKPEDACRARTSIIAHSMGNYALEYAMNALWTRKNRPLLTSLLQEVLMVAADVDNDLFRSGDKVTHGDGEGLANLSYRITALYTGLDQVLGSSAGLKHFGKRRLGRSGLDQTCPVPDNVWDVDCTTLFNVPRVNGITIHGEYFNPAETKVYDLMRSLLHGVDRSILVNEQLVPQALPKAQTVATVSPAS